MYLYNCMLEYAKLQNIKLLPYQKVMLQEYCNNNFFIMPRQFGRRNLIELILDYQELKKDDEIKVHMNGHRLYKFEYTIDKDNNIRIKDSVFEKFRNKKIIGYKKDGSPKYEPNDIYVEGEF